MRTQITTHPGSGPVEGAEGVPLSEAQGGLDSDQWLVEFGKGLPDAVFSIFPPDSVERTTRSDSPDEPGDPWQVSLSLSPVSLPGGGVLHREFALDLRRLQGLFDHIDGFAWYSMGSRPGSDLSHVFVRGTARGQRVVVRVLATPYGCRGDHDD